MSTVEYEHPGIPQQRRSGDPHDRDPIEDMPSMAPNAGQDVLPHVVTFQGLLRNVARTYQASDEAIRDSWDNARFMRNDPGIMECLEQRKRSTALLGWHLECDDEKDPVQKQIAEELTAIIKQIPNFLKYRENLLDALWYGKYGVSHRYRWKKVRGKMRVAIDRWRPINGDKIVFRYDDGSGEYDDDQVGIRVGQGFVEGSQVAKRWKVERINKVAATDWGLAYFLENWERPLVAIHKHMIEDGAYEAPETAGSIHGVGIRSRIYWLWYQKQETLAWLMEYLERSAFGIEIWSYPAGNKDAYEATKTAAMERIGNGRNIVLVPRHPDSDILSSDVKRIEPGMAGADILDRILREYFGWQIKRYILGQILTSETASTGLGSGVATIHLDTYLQIVRYDAINLQETLTTDLVQPLLHYNWPQHPDLPIRFIIETESPDVEGKLRAWKQAYDMGLKLKAQDVAELIGAAVARPGEETLQDPQHIQAVVQQQQMAMQLKAQAQQLEQAQQQQMQPQVQQQAFQANAMDDEVYQKAIDQYLAHADPQLAKGREAYRKAGDVERYFMDQSKHPRSPKPMGITIAAQYYKPGEFIPKEVLQQATEEQKAQLDYGPGGRPDAAQDPEQAHGQKDDQAKPLPEPGKKGQAVPGQQQQPAQPPHDPTGATNVYQMMATRLQANSMLRGTSIGASHDGVQVQTRGGQAIRVRFARAGEIEKLAAQHPEAVEESAKAGGAGLAMGFYRNGEVVLRPGATEEHLNHEMVHALTDMGLITQREVALFGGDEKLAYAYQKWVADGKEQGNSVFARISDWVKSVFGSRAAQQRQTLRAIHAGHPVQRYAQAYQSNDTLRFALEPNKVAYAQANGFLSEHSANVIDLLTRMADIDQRIGYQIREFGDRGDRSVNAAAVNQILAKHPALLSELQSLENEAHALGERSVAILDPQDRTKLAPYTLENRPKIWQNVFANYIDKDGYLVPPGTKGGQWFVTDDYNPEKKDGKKTGRKFVARRISGPFTSPEEAKGQAKHIRANGMQLEGKNEQHFGKIARSIPQTFLETLTPQTFERVRGEVIRGVEKAFRERQELHSELPKFRMEPEEGEEQGRLINPNILLDRKPADMAGSEYRISGPIKKAQKTIAAMNLNVMCPMFAIGGHGCYLDGCYVTAMAAGANPINFYRKAMYSGELLQLRQKDVDRLNALGGLRMNGMGDLSRDQYGQVKDVIKHAGMRGLKLKVITKQDATFENFSRAIGELEKEGHAIPDITVQPTIDPYWVPITEDDVPGAGAEGYARAIQKARAVGDEDRANALASAAADVYKSWGRDVKMINGMPYRKYGFSPQQIKGLLDKYPNLRDRIKPRLLIGNGAEAVWAAKNAPGAVVTWMHSRIRAGMYSDATGSHLTVPSADPKKPTADTDVANFGGRPLFIPPAESDTGRWEMQIHDEKSHSTKATRSTRAVVDYIYRNHPEEADMIFRNLKDHSCCQAGASADACEDCAVHCNAGRSTHPDLIAINPTYQEPSSDQVPEQPESPSKPAKAYKSQLTNLGRAMRRVPFSKGRHPEQYSKAASQAQVEPTRDNPATLKIGDRPYEVSRIYGMWFVREPKATNWTVASSEMVGEIKQHDLAEPACQDMVYGPGEWNQVARQPESLPGQKGLFDQDDYQAAVENGDTGHRIADQASNL
jgi:phage gp29-like protein